MNKNLIIVAIVIVLILFGLGGFMLLAKNRTAPATSSANTVVSPTSANVFSSIKDALSRSISLQCSFTDETGRKIESSIKNGAVRSDITSKIAAESGSVIVKDKKIYFWNSKGGFIMEMPEISVTPKPGTSGAQAAQGQEVIASLEKYKEFCKPAVVADSLFIPPSDVKFQDVSSVIKNAAPSGGVNVPSVNPTDYQQMINKYSNPQQ